VFSLNFVSTLLPTVPSSDTISAEYTISKKMIALIQRQHSQQLWSDGTKINRLLHLYEGTRKGKGKKSAPLSQTRAIIVLEGEKFIDGEEEVSF
jgi:hypothetical protein